jgi:hypothetical protein
MEPLTIYQAIPDLVVRIIAEASDIQRCAERTTEKRDNLDQGDFDGWQNAKIGCAKRTGFEDGIPLWKMHAFHFWAGPNHPLGSTFTLAPEDWHRLGTADSYYLGT